MRRGPTALMAMLFAYCAGSQSSEAPADLAQLGPRPAWLVDEMEPGPLKEKLAGCINRPAHRTSFSIGHRGAPLQFPEHTRESYLAAARMGAGMIECDVTFTGDGVLVCRHAQCDLHTTTDILFKPGLAEKCQTPFTPAQFDPQSGELIAPATARCCSSDLTLAEFQQLSGRPDRVNPRAGNISEYLSDPTHAASSPYISQGELMTHQQSIELFAHLGVKMIPELKSADSQTVEAIFGSQQEYAQQLIDDYKDAGINPAELYPQSFNLADVDYWLQHEPEFGKQSVWLDGRFQNPQFRTDDSDSWSPSMDSLVERGVQFIAPPIWMLLASGERGIEPSHYALAARLAGLQIIPWTFERSPPLGAAKSWYYQSAENWVHREGDRYEVLHRLVEQVGIRAIFTDWAATTTFYANCMDLH